MDQHGFHDGNFYNLLESRCLDVRRDIVGNFQMHSSLIRRLSQEKEMEGHQGCVNAIAWNSNGSLLISGSDDTRVRLFNLSRLGGRGPEDTGIVPSALYQCHTRRVKKLAVEVGNPNVVWSASEDGTLRQHDLRECASCPAAGSSPQECRNILVSFG
ncbi:Protein ALTERED SEED GERMINATION 2 [Linum perenne]